MKPYSLKHDGDEKYFDTLEELVEYCIENSEEIKEEYEFECPEETNFEDQEKFYNALSEHGFCKLPHIVLDGSKVEMNTGKELGEYLAVYIAVNGKPNRIEINLSDSEHEDFKKELLNCGIDIEVDYGKV